MKHFNLKLIAAGLLAAVFMTSPSILLAQNGMSGQLLVLGDNFRNQPNFVTVNGDSALSGRTIFSPSKITTSPDANAKVILTKLGSTVILSPDSLVNLSFDNGWMNGTVFGGTVTVLNIGQTKINLITPDGTVALSNQPTSVQISVSGGKTQVCALDGEVLFNNARVVAGQVQCAAPVGAASGNSSGNSSGGTPGGTSGSGMKYVLFSLLGAATAAVVVGLIVANNDDSTPVSPTR